MSTALAIRSDTLEELPDLNVCLAALRDLVLRDDADTIDEARREFNAHELHARQSGYLAREQQFAKLRLMTEAALGVLSFEDHTVIASNFKRNEWRVLAAAFERGRLPELLEDCELRTSRIVWEARHRGIATVAPQCFGERRRDGSISWRRARELAREKNIPFESLPLDVDAQRRAAQLREERSRRLIQMREAWEREENRKASLAAQRLLREAGDKDLSNAYAWLRRATQACDRARERTPGLARAVACLHEAEAEILEVLK